MTIELHYIHGKKVAEIVADGVVLSTVESGIDLLGNMYYQGFDHVIIYAQNITPDFFDLTTKMAGDIVQKFVQYQLPLTLVGDFSTYNSASLHAFIVESNKGKHIHFVGSLSEALKNILNKKEGAH
jgi:hypothetical protein